MTYLRAWRVALVAAAAIAALAPGIVAQQPESEPLARIEQIIVDGRKKDAPSTSEVKVIRGTTLIAATPSLSLFADDEVITGVNVAMTVLILDAAAEQDNTVHIGAASQFKLRGKRSIFLILGRLLADVRGLFDVVTSRATLGAKSTEFEVRVTETDTQLVVLEGEVAVTEAASGGGAGQDLQALYRSGRGGLAASIVPSRAADLPASLAQQPAAPHQRWTVTVNASAPVKTEQTLAIVNRCQAPHLYDVEGPAALPWFNLFVADRVRVEPGATRTVTVQIQVDPTNVAADTYSGDAVVRCLDCFSEPGCTQSRDLLPVQIKLARSSQLTVRALEEVTIGNAAVPVAPRPATEDRVRTTVNWTNDVIIAAQPTYSARRVIPRYETPEDRARAFREARFSAFWKRDAPSLERLGEVYTEWGEGPKALEAFTLSLPDQGARANAPDYLAKVAEANRLAGRLDDAAQQARRALAAEPQNPYALNVVGNVSMDRAEIALDNDDLRQSEGLLEQARVAYDRSSSALPASDRDARAVNRANMGEMHLQLGNVALAGQRLDVARREYETADGTFRVSHETSPRYAFARTGWGDAFQGMGLVEVARGNADAAQAAFVRADAQYRTGLQAHPDVAENHIGVGDLMLRQGRTKEAVDSYVRAATVKPDDPAAYYRLGTIFERDNPLLAARYLSTYLQLRPAPFKVGRNARHANEVLETIRKSPTAIKVPDVTKQPERSARDIITRSKLVVGTVTTRAASAPAGTVIEQDPAGGAAVRAGAAVNLVLAAAPPGETRPGPVPDVVGMALEPATRAIEAAGFKVGRVERKNSTRPAGTITKQDPDGRRTARPGTVIDLEVAQREVRMVRVPDLVGDTRDHAVEDIQDERLVVGRILEQPGCAAGRVLAQEPAKDTRVPEGSAVTFTVAVPGPQGVSVPQLTGLPQPRAEGLLRERGLRAGRIRRSETDRYEPGTIMSQDPRPGVPIAPGCGIDLEVAIPIPLITVPNFVGMTEAQARQRLPGGVIGAFAELRLGEVTYRDATTDTLRSRTSPRVTTPTVIEQSPAANSQVRRGTQVSLVVLRPPSGGDPDTRVQVPNLQGLTLEEARKVLASSGLSLGDVGYSPRSVSRTQTNRIISQQPAAGGSVSRGTRVSVVIDGYGKGAQQPVP